MEALLLQQADIPDRVFMENSSQMYSINIIRRHVLNTRKYLTLSRMIKKQIVRTLKSPRVKVRRTVTLGYKHSRASREYRRKDECLNQEATCRSQK